MTAVDIWDKLAAGDRSHDPKCRHKDGPAHVGICRDEWTKPIILDPAGKRSRAYFRASSFGKMLEDDYLLKLWMKRMVATGLVMRNDLLVEAASVLDDRNALNRVVEAAEEAAGARARARIGTSLHKLCEQHDLGNTPAHVPDEFRADLDAYIATTSVLGIRPADVEVFGVIDDLKIAGTADRFVTYKGHRYATDIKSGTLQPLACSVQLAIYARMQRYDHETGSRSSLGAVDQRNAIIIHLPAGTGTCTLHWVNIKAGWDAVQLAAQVRAWRATKGLTREWVENTNPTQPD
jgi:hypothetical protein